MGLLFAPSLFAGPPEPPAGLLAFHENRDVFLSRDRGATATNLTSHPADDVSPCISPDGSQVAFQSNRAGRPHLFVVAAGGGPATQLTSGPSLDQSPSWAPGGKTIYFDSFRDDGWRICAVPAAGGAVRVLSGAGLDCLAPACSPDGALIACQVRRTGTERWAIGVLDKDGKLLREISVPGAEFNETPSFSPDGKWIFFAASGPDGYRLCRAEADGSGQPVVIGDWPGWKLHPTPAGAVLLFDERTTQGWRLGLLDPASGERVVLPSKGERFAPCWRSP